MMRWSLSRGVSRPSYSFLSITRLFYIKKNGAWNRNAFPLKNMTVPFSGNFLLINSPRRASMFMAVNWLANTNSLVCSYDAFQTVQRRSYLSSIPNRLKEEKKKKKKKRAIGASTSVEKKSSGRCAAEKKKKKKNVLFSDKNAMGLYSSSAIDAAATEDAAQHLEGDDDVERELPPPPISIPLMNEAEEVELAAEVSEGDDFAPETGEFIEPDGVKIAQKEPEVVGLKDFSALSTSNNYQSANSASSSGRLPSLASSLLDFEHPLNLRLATLMRQSGKSFRSIAVFFSCQRQSNFSITFEDIASGEKLACTLDQVKSQYFEWIQGFRASYVALFVPTMQSPSYVLLENIILYGLAPRSRPVDSLAPERIDEAPDHFFFSYSRLRDTIAKKRKDVEINVESISMTILNAFAEDWKNFILAPNSCAPQSIIQAAFNFRPKDSIMLNKELLQAQLVAAAECLHRDCKRPGASGIKKNETWSLIFVSSPTRSTLHGSSAPPMQDLLTGQFVEPLTLSELNIIYIIGSGTATEAFSVFPLARKGKRKVSILLQDVENQLGYVKGQKRPLTTVLTQALEQFSRLTWIGLMELETSALRVPKSPDQFYRLRRRSVTREIVPSFLQQSFSTPKSGGASFGGAANLPQNTGPSPSSKGVRRVEDYIRRIFNDEDRLEREKNCRAELRSFAVFFAHLESANTTSARRADNPFSTRNGIVGFEGGIYPNLSATETQDKVSISSKSAKGAKQKNSVGFVDVHKCIPASLPTGPPDAPNPKDRACNAVLVAWDAKRVLLFLRGNAKLREFLCNGGRVWCAQYAQYLLKGFSNKDLDTMERTLLQFHEGPVKGAMSPLAKLKIIYETQLDVAINTRQLISMLHRMDGLLAATEMEINGLQLASQEQITKFSLSLRQQHDQLEKILSNKIQDFTQFMDMEVRKRLNFRSSQDISCIIYGGALCRHLIARFVPVRATRYSVLSLLPHAIARVTGTSLPRCYCEPEPLPTDPPSTGDVYLTPDVSHRILGKINRIVPRTSMDDLIPATSVVVILCKTKQGCLVEQLSIYCPETNENIPEINLKIAIDEVVPVTDEPDLVTITQARAILSHYKPLLELQKRQKKLAKKSSDLSNLLIVTNCTFERLEGMVDTGIVRTVAETIFGEPYGGSSSEHNSDMIERVSFAEIKRSFPLPEQNSDSFESDFSELSNADNVSFSAKSNWEAYAHSYHQSGGYEGALRALISYTSGQLGTPRDAFRHTHPLPSRCQIDFHGQSKASTDGILWTVTPESLHSTLQQRLRGRSPSSGADAVERMTVLLSTYPNIDLSFFTALQELRFNEKKMQLFEDGALFRAVLPENNDRVHGEFCHTVTATGRLSSQSPNLQNIPKEEDLRRLIISRFGREGRMLEADYSQLEVVVLAALSRDPQMISEIKQKIDFHCLRVSLMTKEPYEDIYRKTKVEKNPEYIQLRQQAKVFSFQRQYGAGASTIATTTGLTDKEVERLIGAEEKHYSKLNKYYYPLVTDCVMSGADRLLRLRTLENTRMRRIVLLLEPQYYFVVPTGSKFDFTKDKKSIPRLKNYPVQGLAGEIVQIMCGKIIRHFLKRRNYSQKAFVVNTVHDCVWVDAHASVVQEVENDLKLLMSHTQDTIHEIFPELQLDVPFHAEIHSGPSLGELAA